MALVQLQPYPLSRPLPTGHPAVVRHSSDALLLHTSCHLRQASPVRCIKQQPEVAAQVLKTLHAGGQASIAQLLQQQRGSGRHPVAMCIPCLTAATHPLKQLTVCQLQTQQAGKETSQQHWPLEGQVSRGPWSARVTDMRSHMA